MKEYSAFVKTISVIISIILSYFLIIIKFQYISELLSNIIGEIRIWMVIELGSSLLCIIVPILVSWYKFKFKLSYLLCTLPIIFILVLIYSPSGLYFIIPKGPFLISDPIIDNWKYGIAIAIMFYILQILAVGTARGIQESKEEEKRDMQLELQQDNLNQEEVKKEGKE